MPDFRTLQSLGLAIAAGAFCVLAPVHSAPAQDADTWRVEALTGEARLRGADGAWHALERGSAVPAGAAVETGANSKLVLAHHKDVVTVSPMSAFQIPAQDPATGPSFLQRLGTLMFRIEHSPGRRFEVDAPHLAAVVKGTVFTVSANETADSVHVAEGAVEVTAALSHKVALLRPGQSAVVSAGGRDLSVLDGSAAKPPQHRSDKDGPGSDAKSTSMAAAGPGLTRTVGEQHVDIAGVTQGLVGGNGRRTAEGLFENHAAQRANGAPQSGRANLTGGANPNAAGGNALLRSANAAGGNPNAGGGNPNAGGGNPNAGGGNPNAGGGNPNAGGGNPNAGGGSGNGNGNGNGGNPPHGRP